MYAALYVIAVEMIGLLIFAPINIGVKYHFSLSRESSIAAVRVYGVRIATVKLENKDERIKISVNGKLLKRKKRGEKETEKKSKGFPAEKIPKILTFLKAERIIGAVYFAALVGGSDAGNCAVKIAALDIAANVLSRLAARPPRAGAGSAVYPDFDSDRLDFDLRTHARINVYQIFQFVLMMVRNPARLPKDGAAKKETV